MPLRPHLLISSMHSCSWQQLRQEHAEKPEARAQILAQRGSACIDINTSWLTGHSLTRVHDGDWPIGWIKLLMCKAAKGGEPQACRPVSKTEVQPGSLARMQSWARPLELPCTSQTPFPIQFCWTEQFRHSLTKQVFPLMQRRKA